MKQPSSKPPNAGDEARPGTPGTGEDICPECNGKGKSARVRGIGGA
jgi:hypothetical protein